MHKANQRMTTVHVPDGHKPPRERCAQERPQCTMNHYYSVPAITLRGMWNFQDAAHIPGRN